MGGIQKFQKLSCREIRPVRERLRGGLPVIQKNEFWGGNEVLQCKITNLQLFLNFENF